MAKDSRHYDAKAPRFKSWMTPPDFFKKLDEEFHFTLDAAASHENALCECYCTLDGAFQKNLPTVDLRKDYEVPPIAWSRVFSENSPTDGLRLSWFGRRVFCNPPYDTSIGKWVDKAFQFEAEVAVLLLPPSFDTAWGQRIWEAYRWNEGWEYHVPGKNTVEVCLPPGRLRFLRPAFKNPKSTLKDYEVYGEAIFDYSKPPVPGEAPRAGNLIAIFRQ